MDLWILPLALVVGLLLGTLGGGGAILTVPILTTLVQQSPSQATAGSLVIVGLSSAIGMLPHLRAGRIRVAEGLTFGVLGVAGAAMGSRVSTSVRGPVLMTAFACLLLVVAAIMWRRRVRSGRGAARSAGGADQSAGRSWPVQIAAATGVGMLTGFFGVGGGFVIVPALTLVLGLSMTTAVATSLLVIALNSVSSLAARAVGGLDLDWLVVLPFAALTVIGTLLGGRLSRCIDASKLQVAFIGLLVLVGLGVAAQNVPQLV